MRIHSLRQTTALAHRRNGLRLILTAILRTNGCCHSPTLMHFQNSITWNCMPYPCQSGIRSATRNQYIRRRVRRFPCDRTVFERTSTLMFHSRALIATSYGSHGSRFRSIDLEAHSAIFLPTGFDCTETTCCYSRQPFVGNARIFTSLDSAQRIGVTPMAGMVSPTTKKPKHSSSCSKRTCLIQSDRCSGTTVRAMPHR